MAISVLRLRRAIPFSPSLLNLHLHLSSFIVPPPNAPPNPAPSPVTYAPSPNLSTPFVSQSRLFRASPVSFSSSSRFNDRNPNDEGIRPDTILFEGCDYNHWLITMEFPRFPCLSREEKIETYVQTAAKVFGSVEEAKQKIYALSTTTYEGFQVLCSEETSEKFKELPGVVFVLPDSYIDPVNKEYGGDKYTNGVIIERPPPVQYGRQRQNQRENQSYGPRRPRNQGPPPQSHFQQPSGPPPPQQHYNAPQGPPPRQPYYGQPQQGPQTYGEQHSPPMANHNNLRGLSGLMPNVGPRQDHVSPQGPPSQQGYGFQQNRGPPGSQMGPLPVNNSPGGFDSYQGSPPHPQGAFGGENKNNGHTQGESFGQEPTRSQWHGTTAPSFSGENKNYGHTQGERFGQESIRSEGHGTTAPSFVGENKNYGHTPGERFGQESIRSEEHGTTAPSIVGENKNYGLTQDEHFGQEPTRSHWHGTTAPSYGQNHPSERNQLFSQPESVCNVQGDVRYQAPTWREGLNQVDR